MDNPRIALIEWAPLLGQRPRAAGANAYMEALGPTTRLPLARVTLSDGSSGFGWSLIEREAAATLAGRSLGEVFDPKRGVLAAGLGIEEPLWDLVGMRSERPVYSLLAAITKRAAPEMATARCYDTTLYFDELHIADDLAAGRLMAEEALQGFERGHRAFKIKIGRGCIHLPTEVGLRRDVAVVRAIRRAVGPDCPIMVDANNGYSFNNARDFLAATADLNIFWLEEAFAEDPILYRRLRDWMGEVGIQTLIADGEGRGTWDPRYRVAAGESARLTRPVGASPHLLEWARRGVIDVAQYDIHQPGITFWLENGPILAAAGCRAAPHHYGSHSGNYTAAHLAQALESFLFVEWDEASTPGLEAPGYTVADGLVRVPPSAGFGLLLDNERFRREVSASGFRVAAPAAS